MLLGPVASHLGTKRLLIVSDGALQYIPFAALPRPFPGHSSGRGYRNNQPMVLEHEIINLPSASTLAVLRNELAGRHPAPKIAAVFADPVFEATDLRLKRGTNAEQNSVSDAATSGEASLSGLQMIRSLDDADLIKEGRLAIPRLPYSRGEAEVIRKLVPEKSRRLAVGLAVNHAAVTDPELEDYAIVHFATHSLLNSNHPELSGVLLSMVDEHGQPQERGILSLGEIYNLKLRAEMVVLSACRTALGKDVKGEGLIGLTRGFMYAGAARVVASLWKADDEATAELMRLFYQRMLGKQQLRPAAALRHMQIEMWRSRSKWSVPYYWAAFTLQGEWK
jgi:CHAT domain-containing protein